MKKNILKNALCTIVLLSLSQMSVVAADYVPKGAPETYPKGETGEMVKLGEEIMLHTDTHPLTKDMVGNKLQCVNCHLKGSDGKPGTTMNISTFIGTATVFPAYSKREGTMQTLQDRIDNCFMRSMNGKRPIIDTEASLAMATYITWLSTGMAMHMDPKRPVTPLMSERWANTTKKFGEIIKKSTHDNYLNGKKLFTEKCVSCHGANGEGMPGAFPPLWGKDKTGNWLSYNTGAGMSKLNKSAAWVQSNMPLGQGDTLKDQEAADVMLYVNAQPHADFSLQRGLYSEAKMGYYNSKVHDEKHSVRSNFKQFGLDIDQIRGDKIIK